MTPMKFGAGDNPRFAKGRETHGLRTIELRVLEGRQAYEPRRHCRRQIGPIYIELVGDHDDDLARQENANRARLGASRRRHAPRLVCILIFDGHADAQNAATRLRIVDDFGGGLG
jgi:hypothetical protein